MKPANPIEVLRAIHEFFREGEPVRPSALFDDTRTFKEVVNACIPTTAEDDRAIAFAEDVSWLRTMRADYANLCETLVDAGTMENYVSSWDQDAHDECLMRTERAVNEVDKLYPHEGP